MKNNSVNFLQKIKISKKTRPGIGRVIIALIITQSFLAPIISIWSLNGRNENIVFINLHSVIAYTTIVLCILFFPRKSLGVFYDRFSLSLIALACIVRPLFFSGNGLIYDIVMASLGIALFFFIKSSQKKIEIPNLKSVLIGLMWSLSTVLAVSIIRVFSNSGPTPGSFPSNLATFIFNSTLSGLTFSVLEEAYFRGLLFSLLVMNGWGEDKALFAQGLLFWGSHYLDIGDPIFFFVMIPLITISITLIIRKYKMLYMSIMVHLIINIFLSIFVTILSKI